MRRAIEKGREGLRNKDARKNEQFVPWEKNSLKEKNTGKSKGSRGEGSVGTLEDSTALEAVPPRQGRSPSQKGGATPSIAGGEKKISTKEKARRKG